MGYDLAMFQSREAASVYVCVVCNGVVDNPMFVGDCEHFVCEENCLNRIHLNCERCPYKGCNENFRSRKANPGFLRLYNALRVNCVHCKEWSGCLSELATHYSNTCVMFPVRCENEGCEQTRNRDDMDQLHSHLCGQRVDPCQYCGVNVSRAALKDHFKCCESYPVLCNHLGCDFIVRRNELAAHQQSECLFTVIQCEWSEFGCTHTSKRKDMSYHYSKATGQHLNCVKKVLGKIVSVLSSDKPQHAFALSDLKGPQNTYHKQRYQNEDLHFDPKECLQVLTDMGDEQVFEQLPSKRNYVKKLDMGNCRKLTDNAITRVTQITPHLQYVDMHYCKQITDQSITELAQNCPQLLLLDLRKCNQITDTSITQLVQNCKQIRHLDLTGCTRLTIDSITQITQHCKKLRSLRLPPIQITDTVIFDLAKNCVELAELWGCSSISPALEVELRSLGIDC
eukprot:TRINITY_DN208_c0_g1_i1.p1 TRINITY_DN208_c0_g1~~TRINITY_DN208_c0_g1_i1.p1  ORF type:complete len:453 (-),score=32.96 TRINITY_DN208_c0_g1_i1:124-1482(-)